MYFKHSVTLKMNCLIINTCCTTDYISYYNDEKAYLNTEEPADISPDQLYNKSISNKRTFLNKYSKS